MKEQQGRMNKTDNFVEQLRRENMELRRIVSDLTQENLRIRIAFSDALNVLNAARTRLEASARPSVFSGDSDTSQPQTVNASAAEHLNSTSEVLSIVEELQFRDQAVRLLSDGTIEADTPDGALRFEDLGHLEETYKALWPTEAEDGTGHGLRQSG